MCACASLPPQLIGDLVGGSVLGDNVQRANEARIASFFAGIPEEVPIRIINRFVRLCVQPAPPHAPRPPSPEGA